MKHNRLLSSTRRRKNNELNRLDRLITAAGMGTAWLGGMPVDRKTLVNTALVRAQNVEGAVPCSHRLENCHGHA